MQDRDKASAVDRFGPQGSEKEVAAGLLESARRGDDSATKHLSMPLRAMWQAKAGNWDRAHELCQDAGSGDGAWVHGYLHRVEGDAGNARYWYQRAGKPFPAPETSLDHEWLAIVEALAKK